MPIPPKIILAVCKRPARAHPNVCTVESAYNEGIGGKKKIRYMQTFVICGKLFSLPPGGSY